MSGDDAVSHRKGPIQVGLPWLVGLLLGVLAVGPGLERGFVLRYDMVFVPNPPLGPVQLGAGEGFPRAVPSDAFAALLSKALPADIVQSVLLLAIFALSCAGAARLVPGPLVARLAAGVLYAWNPFIAERLLLGQWALLLGYAGLPWVLSAAARLAKAKDLPRLVTALVPAAIGGFSSTVLSALVAVPTALARPGSARRRLGSALLAVAAVAVVSLPWLLPALSAADGGARTDPGAVDLFAARADTPFGAAGSLLTLGGIWNARAVPDLYGHPFFAACRLALTLAALAGWVRLLRRGSLGPAGPGLTAAALAGFAVALLGTADPGRDLLRALIEAWPGFGALRDGHLYTAPLALLQAVGLGGAAMWLAEGAGRADRFGTVAAALLLAAPLVLLPGLAWGAAGRLAPVHYPAEWTEVQRRVDADPAPGSVLVLPWSAYRGLETTGPGRTAVVLDPAVKLFERPAVWNDDLRVADGGTVRAAEGEDPAARAVAEAAARPGGAGAPEIGALGVRYVLIEREAPDPTSADGPRHLSENRFSPAIRASEKVHDGPLLTLYRLPDEHVGAVKVDLSGLEVTGWLVTVGSILWSLIASSSNLVSMRPLRPVGAEPRKENPS
ncbi:hypothetical protein O4J56_25330 [Nocardiopsis sp. RSe5-2]|uniref:YfhO family protein n=1 Tax=Nocardiopsis endophytica TaxID=3018445 RepID=A0ABT4UAJ7_9ACTN|nr:hypothetical protein [Nocardiopsis endophytica]MDA2813993.1 hypothetical protein [Nocardiopsis endophytica]